MDVWLVLGTVLVVDVYFLHWRCIAVGFMDVSGVDVLFRIGYSYFRSYI